MWRFIMKFTQKMFAFQKAILIICAWGLCGNLFAQSNETPIKFNGEIRARSEADGRDFDKDSHLNTYSLLRTRLGASINPLEDIKLYIQIQDARAFGQEPSTLEDNSSVELHQAFFQIDSLWRKPVHLKIGRQEMAYDNERLIGPEDWSNVGRTFDGIQLTIGGRKQLNLFGMIIDENNVPVEGAATPLAVIGRDETSYSFYGAYYKHPTFTDFKFNLYGFYEADRNETVSGKNDLKRATLGTFNKGKFSSDLDFESELALQFGKRRGQDLLAFMVTGSLGYTFSTPKQPSLRLGFDYFSGMEPDSTDYRAFDNLFGSHHKFYGMMDYFYNIAEDTQGRGLIDIMLKSKIPIANTWLFTGDFHHFRAAKGDERSLGSELDLILNYQYNSAISFVFGTAFFVPGNLMRQTFLHDDVGIWSYTSLLVTF